ncbi:uncharacterized protein LOC112348697 [Selaginella moellendorffii]|uniref:uncharacterized protein LOC112348697 n=1 Tax=Selaginella moellendorffii TaxID=88036 RepID=UPI000D1C5BD7|nr:uncharacterized protein LOC112348697 [Selaginella moellendorffii]|eukprot:XP_024537487.1 uncharacterized protein LOC112348697 [Selaginella moellendorffii]
MLVHTKKLAYQIGYDRPSQKLLSFLAKHYNLKRFYPQANQFVIYNAYFDSSCPDDMRVQSRVCDCIRGNQKSCAVALLDSPRAKEIYHGRRANKTPEPEPDIDIEPAPLPVSAKYTESSSDDKVTVLQEDEVKVVPSVTQVFSELQGMDNHYDWMTGMKKPLLKPARSVAWKGVEFPSQDLSSTGLMDRGKLKSSSDVYDSLRLGSAKSPVPEGLRRSKSPKSSHRAQLSGFGAAAALGFNQR